MRILNIKISILSFIVFAIWVFPLSVSAQSIVNSAPVADAGRDLIRFRGAQVFLNNSSSDPDGDLLEYRWWIYSAPDKSNATLTNPNTKTPFFFADVEGEFVIHLLASDGIFTSNIDEVVVRVMANSAPIIVVDPYYSSRIGELVILDASASLDFEQRELQFRWSIKQAPKGGNAHILNSERPQAEFIADRAGLYIFRVWVSDSFLSSETYVAVRVHTGSCEIPGKVQGKQCRGVFEIASNEDLMEYLKTYGLNNEGTHVKNARLTQNLSLSGDVYIATPCSFSMDTDADLNVEGNLCINAKEVFLAGRNRLYVGQDIHITSSGKMEFSRRSTVEARSITLQSSSNENEGSINFDEHANITATSLRIKSNGRVNIGANSEIALEGNLSIKAEGHTSAILLSRKLSIHSKSVSLISDIIDLGGGTEINSSFIEGIAHKIMADTVVDLTSDTVYLDSDNCQGISSMRIIANTQGGSCLSNSSLLASIMPLSRTTVFVGEEVAFNIANSRGYESATLDFGDTSTHTFGANELATTHAYNTVGTYQVALTVGKEDQTATQMLELTVIDNTNPVLIDFSALITYDDDGFPHKQVDVHISRLTLSGGVDAKQYEYNFGDGSATHTTLKEKARHTYENFGTYTVRVRVQDHLGRWSNPIAKEVILQNEAPTAIFELKDEAYTYEVFGLSALDCSDPEGSLLSYEWIIDGEHFSSHIVEAHFFEEEGLHHITLIVKDDKGRRNYITKKIKVNDPPEGALRAKMSITAEQDEHGGISGGIFASSTGSSIENGEIVRRAWNLSNGESRTGDIFSTRLEPGKYLLTLELESSNGTIVSTAEVLNVVSKYKKSETPSPINVTISGHNANAFNPTSLTLNIIFDGEGINLGQDIEITSDYTSVVSSITKTSSNEITMVVNAHDGFNNIYFNAFDKNGYYIQENLSFFAGSRTITVDILDQSDSNVTNGVWASPK